MIEHLADSLADHMRFTAAAGARLMLEIEPHVLAGQMRRQAWSIGPRSWLPDRRWWRRGFDPRDICVEVLAALQLLNDEPEAFDPRRRKSCD
jgi:hypothetical protein